MEENVFEFRVLKIISLLLAIVTIVLIIIGLITGIDLEKWYMGSVIVSFALAIISEHIDFGFSINRDNGDFYA